MPRGVWERTEVHRAAISAAVSAWQVGRVLSPEHRAAISAGLVGNTNTRGQRRVISSETRALLSAAFKANPNRLGYPKGECVWCFGVATQMDHIIPRDHPQHTPCHDGCERVPSCASCNKSKGPRTPEEWFASLR